jgi:hypothetical protein
MLIHLCEPEEKKKFALSPGAVVALIILYFTPDS